MAGRGKDERSGQTLASDFTQRQKQRAQEQWPTVNQVADYLRRHNAVKIGLGSGDEQTRREERAALRRHLRAAGEILGVKVSTMSRPDDDYVLGYTEVDMRTPAEQLADERHLMEAMNKMFKPGYTTSEPDPEPPAPVLDLAKKRRP